MNNLFHSTFSHTLIKRVIIIIGFTLAQNIAFGQGFNHQWLLGSYNFFSDPKGRILFDSTNYTLINENRKIVFKGTEGNISDVNGNLLMSSNGVWIANSNSDTMMNGSGINPNGITSNWPFGLPLTANNIFLPFPDDSSKFILFHHTATFDGYGYPALEIYYSIIDKTLDNGLGAVISKNDTALIDTLNWGMGACRHANGRDWWLVVSKQNSNIWFKLLIQPNGIINLSAQNLIAPVAWYNVTQPTFSLNGNKFAYSIYDSILINSSIIISDFSRCTGTFSNTQSIPLTSGFSSGSYLQGLSFSPSGNFLYACSDNYIFQVDLNSFAIDTVASYDGFISPGPTCCATSFWNMYLAANGKIYVTSGSSVEHLHVINYPDSAGTACNVQQHAISLGYAQLRAVPNHPNYYLGCDSTIGCGCITSINEQQHHDFHFRIYPNPISNNTLHIGYLLPQNKSGTFEIYDITGKIVFKYNLPQWSNEQSFTLPKLSNGIYQCIIKSNNSIAAKKLIVIADDQ